MGTARKRILGTTVSVTRDEELLSASVIDPANITVGFDNVGGLEEAKQLLQESVVWPLTHPDLFPVGSMRSPPTGVLLFGPPGTGKTLLAKALAKELNGFFIEVSPEQLFSKYVGDSEKACAAVFSLAKKLQTCVIFVDEMDTLLSARTSNDSAVYSHAKSIFMTKWDGMTTGNDGSRVIVVGATNRPRDLDEAILRRLPLRINVPFPTTKSREQILRILLAQEPQFLAVGDAGARDHLLRQVAATTEGFSGSDLKELCKAAASVAFRDSMRQHLNQDGQTPLSSAAVPSALSWPVFQVAMKRISAATSFEI
jgi:SpoVK/Ycf46/Vps4 family AAA+-type ATPase